MLDPGQALDLGMIFGPFSISAIDLDGERLLLVAAADEGTVHVVRREIDGWVPAVDIEVGAQPLLDGVVVDLDADGADDVAIIAEGDGGGSTLWVGRIASAADGHLAQRLSIDLGAAVTAIHAADLDADGGVDLLVTDLPGVTVCWLRNLGDGTFAPDEPIDLDGPLMGIAPADVDGDGIVELAVLPASEDRLDVLRDVAGTLLPSG